MQSANENVQLELQQIIDMFDTGADAAEQASLVIESLKPVSFTSDVKNVLLSMSATSEGSGHYRAVLDIARELKRFGYSVSLLLIQEPEMPLSEEFEVIVEPDIVGIKTKETYASLVKMWEEILTRLDIQAVVFNQYLAADKIWHTLAIRYAQLAQGRQHIPVYVKVHGVFTRQEDQSKEYLLNNATAFRSFDGIICGNTVDAAFWSTYNKNVFVRPLPVDPVVTDNEIDVTKHDVLYLANLGDTKNQLDAIKAIEIAMKDVPDVRLVLAGGNSNQYEKYFNKCMKYIESADASLKEHVIFTGYLEGDAKAEIMRQCSIALSTSRHEGFGISLIEEIRAGLPLIAYDLPNCEVCTGYEESGVIGVTVKTPANLAREIVRVLSDRSLHRDLSEKARQHAVDILSFDYASFWERCLHLEATEVEITPEIQARIYRVLYNTFHLMLSRNNALKKRQQKLQTQCEALREKNAEAEQTISELRENNKKLEERIDKVTGSRSYQFARSVSNALNRKR